MKAKFLQTKCDINDWFRPIRFDINFQQGIWTGVDDLWKVHLEQNISATDTCIYARMKTNGSTVSGFIISKVTATVTVCVSLNIPCKHSTANQ